MLSDNELLRHSRSISLDEFGIEGQLNIKSSSILVCGAGGIASSFLPAIASSGFAKLGVVDYDKIELSNLSRQFLFTEQQIGSYKSTEAISRMIQINPSTQYEEYNMEVSQKTHNEVDLIASNFNFLADITDSISSRKIMNAIAIKQKKVFFTAASVGFAVHCYIFAGFKSNQACYNCLFPDISEDDANSNSCNNIGVFNIAPNLAGLFLASEILKVASKIYKTQEEYASIFLRFDSLKNVFSKSIIKKDKSCPICN